MNNGESHVVVAIIIWCSAILGFLASYVFSQSPRVLSLGNTFGGGVLLAAGLVHLTNDAFENFEKASEDSWAKRYDYPWAAFFVCLGFLVTLVIEVTVLQIIDGTIRYDEDSQLREDLLSGNAKIYNSTEKNRKHSSLHEAIVESALEGHHHQTNEGTKDVHKHSVGDVMNRGMAIAIIFFCAISCHSFIAGLGIGVVTGNELWSTMIAIIAHKGLATFTLANCFMNANCSKATLISFIFGFSLVTPLGILCGSLMSTSEGATQGVLIGLAGGSFLYVGIIEVISKEVANPFDWKWKLLLLIIGWGIMSLLGLWV